MGFQCFIKNTKKKIFKKKVKKKKYIFYFLKKKKKKILYNFKINIENIMIMLYIINK